MLFKKKKKRMVDVRELQKRGVVVIPKDDSIVPTNQDGFVEIGAAKSGFEPTRAPTSSSSNSASNDNFFGFMDSPSTSTSSFSSESDGYNKREVDAKITELDNKIYKLEQRIELLERKLDVNQSSNVGPAGW